MSIPGDKLRARISACLGAHRRVEAKMKLVGVDEELVNACYQAIMERLLEVGLYFSTSAHDEDDLGGTICDYTGTDLKFATGHANFSIEAIYPFAKFRDQVFYHAPLNVGIVAFSVNFAKRQYPPVMLPLVAAYLRTRDLADPDERRSHQTWLYQAICNATILDRASRGIKADRLSYFRGQTNQQQRDILEALRTGTRNSTVNEAISSHSASVWATRATTSRMASTRTSSQWDDILEIQCRIGRHYGLTRQEFRYFCTIPTSGRRSRRVQVFYPFSAMSRPQAAAQGWNWVTLYSLLAKMIYTMKHFCNAPAEAAGLGQAELDEDLLLWFLTHHICSQIRELKEAMIGASMEDIARAITDRWGLPMVPWTSHPFAMSLCKVDHGTAMLIGIKPHEGRPLDPVLDIDLEHTTATVDTWFTNATMWRWQTGAWASIRDLLCLVPDTHPFWAIDKAMGGKIWVGEWERTAAVTARKPPSQFDTQIDLQPIDHWLTGDESSMLVFDCKPCDQAFGTAGALVRHCREHHANTTTCHPNDEDLDVDTQGDLDKAYWNAVLVCKHGCGYTITVKTSLYAHESTCPARHGRRRFSCPRQCGHSSLYKFALNYHVAHNCPKRPNIKEHSCEFGCGYKTTRRSTLLLHTRRCAKNPKNTGPRITCERGCGYSTTSQSRLKRHQDTCRNNPKTQTASPTPCKFGCGYESTFKRALAHHHQRCVSNLENCYEDEKPCKYGCGYTSKIKPHLEGHEGTCPKNPKWKDASSSPCKFGCGFEHSKKHRLKAHENGFCPKNPKLYYEEDTPCKYRCGYTSKKTYALHSHHVVCPKNPDNIEGKSGRACKYGCGWRSYNQGLLAAHHLECPNNPKNNGM